MTAFIGLHPLLSSNALLSFSNACMTCRPHAPIPPPPHPNFDLHASVRLALEEDAGNLGDVTTLST